MKNILIIGANGSLARAVIAAAERHPALRLTLFARKNAAKTHRTFDGDALNVADLTAAMAGRTWCTSIWRAIWAQWARTSSPP